jgi:acyl-CoA dehydrogenase
MRQVRSASAQAGYYTMFCPVELGGGGLGPLAYYEAWEHLAHHCGPGRLLPYQTIAHWTNGPSYLHGFMTDEMKARVLNRFMSGEQTMCFAMSEPDAGSDAWAMSTRATRQGDGWVLNGVKQWITNSPYAQFALVFAVTDEELRATRKGGISCFLVATDSPGYRIDSVIKVLGEAGGNESILSFNDVYVPDDCVVGEIDDGFALAIGGVSLGRIFNAGRCVGLSRWALERATAYAKERKTFGKAISEYQGVSFQLADSAIEIYATKTMSVDCAKRLERGEDASRELTMVKAYSTEMCFRVFDRCIQVHGGMGLTNEMRLYDGWHLARIIRIADGSGEIMRRNIARALFRGETDF